MKKQIEPQGDHNWPLTLEYHLCPQCGAILESREAFRYQMGEWIKKLACERCGHKFAVKQKRKPKFGPLTGEEQPPEWDWS
jgi:DNA-directed RNA polymerase subunit RPC12/RpoP